MGGIGTGSVMEGKVSLEIVCRDLQRMIREEARSAALAGKICMYVCMYGWMDGCMIQGSEVKHSKMT